MTVTEPTTLMVNPATSEYSDATTVSGVLTDSVTNAPIAGEPVTFDAQRHRDLHGETDATGTASCSITPGEPSRPTLHLTGTFAGDTTLPLTADASRRLGQLRGHAGGDHAHLHRWHRRPRTGSH